MAPPSSRVAVVVLQQSPQPLSASDRALSRCPVAWQRHQHDIPHALMGALLMIMRFIPVERVSEGALAVEAVPAGARNGIEGLSLPPFEAIRMTRTIDIHNRCLSKG